MKPLFVIFLLLFVSSAAVPMYVFAQDNVPVLDEWYSIKSPEIGSASYLKNFIIPGGENSITIKFHSKEKPVTWFNRFPFDTVNQFYWPNEASGCVYQGDFNGDGVMDYVDCNGNIYRGIENGMPPDTHAVAKYWFSSLIDDFNGDGYDDMLWLNVSSPALPLLHFVFGGKDLNKLQGYNFQQNKIIYPIGVYKTGNECRLVSWESRTDSLAKREYQNFCLYRLSFYNEQDSIKARIEKLDSTGEVYRNTNLPFYDIYRADFSKEYHKKNSKKAFLIADSVIDWGMGKNLWIIWDLSNDKFELKFKTNKNIPGVYLTQSIDGNDSEDLLTSDIEDNKIVGYVVTDNWDNIFQEKNFTYKAKFYLPCIPESVFAIGDINNDGINDFAINSWRYDKALAIYLGKNLYSGIKDEFSLDFKVNQNEPNPIGSDLLTFLPIEISYPDNYSLKIYSLDGQEIAELFNKYLSEGSKREPINLSSYKLTSGFYVLRLSNSRTTKERGILITK